MACSEMIFWILLGILVLVFGPPLLVWVVGTFALIVVEIVDHFYRPIFKWIFR